MVYASHSHSMLCILLSRPEDIRILFTGNDITAEYGQNAFSVVSQRHAENVSDAMTGLYNRKILTPVLEQRLQQLVNTGTLVTFIAIDCDKLKVINDTLGHKEGDRIITHLAKAIQSSIRKSDYAIRLGGDEFCIILIDHPSDLTPRLLERIRYNLQIIAHDISISFSAGVYNMQPNDTIDDAYKASDAQLYLNKQKNTPVRDYFSAGFSLLYRE